MNVETYLALTHLVSRRKGAWAWVVSLMTTASVALGVAALVITLAVMTGFREDIQSKILGVQPHIILTPWGNSLNAQDPRFENTLKGDKEVLAWSPFISGQLLIGFQGQNSGAIVKGIDPQKELSVVDLKSRLIKGNWDDLARSVAGKPAVFLGSELARSLGVRVGDEIWGVAPGDLANSLGGVPRVRRFGVRGILETGYYEWDTSLAVMDLGQARTLFGVSGASGIGVRIRDLDDAEKVAQRLRVSLGGAALATSWLAMNRNLFSALALEKKVMFIILILVTLVASFMIVSNLLLNVTQRVKEIGILRAMGATSGVIHKTFMIEGVLMGATGTGLGLIVGLFISKLIAVTKLISLPSDVYYIDKLPAKVVLWPDVCLIALAAGTITFLATLYPAHRAAKLDPLEAIRFG